MPPDFTYGAYAGLLDAGLDAGFPFLTVREYLTADPLPERFVILRHDVDRKPGNALDFARIEAERGLSASYYFRTVEEAYDPAVVRAVEALGHEAGYHYEDLDSADGDRTAARSSFARNLRRLRLVADVDTACMHGNPLTPYDNRDLWDGDPGFDAYDLLGEAYLSMDFTEVDYYSDTGRTWLDGSLKVKDHPVGASGKTVQVASTAQLAALLESTPEGRFYLLTHPDRWADGPVEWAVETAFDTAKNLGKRLLTRLPQPVSR
jgi:hypothetical protein